MESVSDIFTALGGVTAVATALKLPLGTVSAWKTRGSIPPEYWAEIVEMGEARAVDGLSFATMAQIAARARPTDDTMRQAVNQ